jgi:hypothetical protein
MFPVTTSTVKLWLGSGVSGAYDGPARRLAPILGISYERDTVETSLLSQLWRGN